jgi:hypothetical protein
LLRIKLHAQFVSQHCTDILSADILSADILSADILSADILSADILSADISTALIFLKFALAARVQTRKLLNIYSNFLFRNIDHGLCTSVEQKLKPQVALKVVAK